MRKKFILILFSFFITLPLLAQNHWGIMGGANLSTTTAEGFKWRAGGYVGGLYDVQLSESWYVQPQLLFSYEENKSKNVSKTDVFFSQYALTLPVLASFRVRLSDAFFMRVNAGPYVQYALFGNQQEYGEWWHADFGDHFTYGLKGGLALESKHWFGTIDCKYSLKKSFVNYDGHGLTFSAGIGYKF